MISYPITLDGITYSSLHVMRITRSFSVLDGQNAGRVTSGEMMRDIIGTYYNYQAEIDSDAADRAQYDQFFDAISAPEESHTLVVPYAQQNLTFEAYVTQGQDELLVMEPAANRWGNLTFSFIAMAPQRTPGVGWRNAVQT